MGLPVANFCLINIPQILVEAVVGMDTSGLASGVGFGSYDVGIGSRDIEPGDLSRLPKKIFSETLLFDHWIHNADRILTSRGGNPNAVFCTTKNQLVLIDHDNAFDPTYEISEISGRHLGWSERSHWLDRSEQELWLELAKRALDKLPLFLDEIPEAWLESSTDISENRSRFLEQIHATLQLPFSESADFWSFTLPTK